MPIPYAHRIYVVQNLAEQHRGCSLRIYQIHTVLIEILRYAQNDSNYITFLLFLVLYKNISTAIETITT